MVVIIWDSYHMWPITQTSWCSLPLPFSAFLQSRWTYGGNVSNFSSTFHHPYSQTLLTNRWQWRDSTSYFISNAPYQFFYFSFLNLKFNLTLLANRWSQACAWRHHLILSHRSLKSKQIIFTFFFGNYTELKPKKRNKTEEQGHGE